MRLQAWWERHRKAVLAIAVLVMVAIYLGMALL
jgi:uncharacterized protein involved in exopolysaccharide biosynthesis